MITLFYIAIIIIVILVAIMLITNENYKPVYDTVSGKFKGYTTQTCDGRCVTVKNCKSIQGKKGEPLLYGCMW